MVAVPFTMPCIRSLRSLARLLASSPCVVVTRSIAAPVALSMEALAIKLARSPEDLMTRDAVADAPWAAPVAARLAFAAFFVAALSPLPVLEGHSAAISRETLSGSTLDGGWVGADSSDVFSGPPVSEFVPGGDGHRFLGICLSLNGW